MKDLHVTLIQSELRWEDAAANRANFAKKIERLTEPTDLIVLPEMFTTGFTMNPATVAETMDGTTLNWLREMAQQSNAVVTGSVVIEENEQYYNRLIWMRPDGNYDTYDKRHLFTLAGEHKYYQPGTKRLIVELNGWKICPLICYDLRFPVWARNVENYDLLIYVANWPDKRSNAWKALITARAIENQCYTIGVNRVGKDANGHLYSGDSGVADYAGIQLARQSYTAGVMQLKLDAEAQQQFRQKLNFLADRDDFSIEI
ncbi:MAG: amidohydrolase [Saprospiraceae bacterium]